MFLREKTAELFNLRRGELAPVLVAALFFFCLLTALMMLRPARDALGMERGIESIRWLFIGTALVTLAVNPVFGWLVSRFKRLHFIGATYGFFALSLVGFWSLLVFAPGAVGAHSGQVFYVWFSVFNLFVTMVFWALLADRFSSERRFISIEIVIVFLRFLLFPGTPLIGRPIFTPASAAQGRCPRSPCRQYRPTRRPPSTTRTCPVMYLAPCDARKVMTSAISSGSPMRPIGMNSPAFSAPAAPSEFSSDRSCAVRM